MSDSDVLVEGVLYIVTIPLYFATAAMFVFLAASILYPVPYEMLYGSAIPLIISIVALYGYDKEGRLNMQNGVLSSSPLVG